MREGRLVRLEIPRIGDSEDAYGRTLAYVYLDGDGNGRYERLFNEDLIELGLARTTDFPHTYRREFERAREEVEERGGGLWSACPEVGSVTDQRRCEGVSRAEAALSHQTPVAGPRAHPVGLMPPRRVASCPPWSPGCALPVAETS